MKMLTKEQILSSKDLVEEVVDCPEWDGAVKVRALSLAKRNAIAIGAKDMQTDKLDLEKFQLLTFIECVIEPKFTVADYGSLKEKSAAVVERVINRVYAISELHKVEEIKNVSGVTPTA